MAKPILIGDLWFPLRGAAQEACQAVLYKYPPGSVVTDPEDEKFLLDLLQLHPNKDTKIGCGVARFEVRPSEKQSRQRTLWLVRTDGSETDFSFVKCLTPPTHARLVRAALREAIVPQINEFVRNAYTSGGQVQCPLTRADLSDRKQAHVDHHKPTFDELAQAFAEAEGGWEAISVTSSDGMTGHRLADAHQAQAWDEYHRANASLRLVSIQANLSLLRKRTPSS